MIIANGENKKTGDKVIILGMSNENLRQMVSGNPILLRRETHGEGIPEGWEIAIMFGKTEMEIMAQFRIAGVVGKETKIVVDPRL